MTDDEILVAADRIRSRRKNESRLESFHSALDIIIRWDIPGAPFGESYFGITVPASAVADVITKHFEALIAKDRTHV